MCQSYSKPKVGHFLRHGVMSQPGSILPNPTSCAIIAIKIIGWCIVSAVAVLYGECAALKPEREIRNLC